EERHPYLCLMLALAVGDSRSPYVAANASRISGGLRDRLQPVAPCQLEVRQREDERRSRGHTDDQGERLTDWPGSARHLLRHIRGIKQDVCHVLREKAVSRLRQIAEAHVVGGLAVTDARIQVHCRTFRLHRRPCGRGLLLCGLVFTSSQHHAVERG